MDFFEERQSNEFHDKTKILKYLRLIDDKLRYLDTNNNLKFLKRHSLLNYLNLYYTLTLGQNIACEKGFLKFLNAEIIKCFAGFLLSWVFV